MPLDASPMKTIALTTLPVASSPIVRPNPWKGVGAYASLAFFVLAVGAMVVGRNQPWMQNVSIAFVSIVLEAMPFVLLGAIVGGVIEVYLPREKVSDWLPKNPVLQV